MKEACFFDFGFGETEYSPLEAENVEQLLNNLLYNSQKNGNVNDWEKEQFIDAFGNIAHILKEKLKKTHKLRKSLKLQKQYTTMSVVNMMKLENDRIIILCVLTHHL